MTETMLENKLTDFISDHSRGSIFSGCTIWTFEEFGLCTCDKGLVVELADGSTIELTIKGYDRDGVRID